MTAANTDVPPAPAVVGGDATVGRSTAAVVLSLTVAVLAAVAAAVGLLSGGGSGPVPFTTLRGEAVYLFGEGLYRYDTVFGGAGQRGTDAVVLALGVPLLVAAALRYRSGSARAGLLLFGTLGFFLYVYGSAALGTVAYNRLFPLYVALFSASLFGAGALVAAVDRAALATRAVGAPRRGPGVFMLISRLVTAVVWGVPVMAAAIGGASTDRLDSYGTDVTYAIDLGVIAPAALLAGVLILRRRADGYLLALSLLVLEAMLAPMIGAQTVSQLAAGVTLTSGEIIGPMSGFVVLAAASVWFLAGLLRRFGAAVPAGATPVTEGRTDA